MYVCIICMYVYMEDSTTLKYTNVLNTYDITCMSAAKQRRIIYYINVVTPIMEPKNEKKNKGKQHRCQSAYE